MTVDAIIQARCGSTRLPGKIFMGLGGETLLGHIVRRVAKASCVDRIIIATTTEDADNLIELWCKERSILCYRGDTENVLDRYYHAAKYFQSQHIIRITADDPFKDPAVIDDVWRLYKNSESDLAGNVFPVSFPEGLDVEIFSVQTLAKAQQAHTNDWQQEHVTQYFYQNSSLFKIANLMAEKDYSHYRWTIDYAEDYIRMDKIYETLDWQNQDPGYAQIIELVNAMPELLEANSNTPRSAMYANR
jgi:spore coat polysaccharide biosynthesis protein SpsF